MRRRRSRGAALVAVLVALIAVTATGAAIVSRTNDSLLEMRTDRERTRARLAAEGGVEAARAALRRDPAWAGGEFAAGGVAARVEVRAGPEAGERIVESRAGGAVLEAALRLRDGLPAVVRWRER